MRINSRKREISLKVVYYGCGLCGKTTNLVQLHGGTPSGQRGSLVQLDTETERTLFFDYFPLDLGEIGGFKLKLDFFTVPGQSFYHATRKAVLEGADGVVFVADSHPDREQANVLSRQDMIEALAERGRRLEDIPHVYQWNKRDVPGAMSVKLLNKLLNPEGAASIEAIAANGIGVRETQALIVKQVIANLRRGREAEATHG